MWESFCITYFADITTFRKGRILVWLSLLFLSLCLEIWCLVKFYKACPYNHTLQVWQGILSHTLKSAFLNTDMVGSPWLEARTPPSHPITALLSRTGGGGESDEINLMAQGKGSLTKQKQRPCTEAKENTRFALSVPWAGHTLPLPGQQGFSTLAPEDKHCN